MRKIAFYAVFVLVLVGAVYTSFQVDLNGTVALDRIVSVLIPAILYISGIAGLYHTYKYE